MHTITHNNQTIQFELLRKPQLKNTYIQVKNNIVLVKTNEKTSLNEIKSFVAQKAAWILKHLEAQKVRKKSDLIVRGSLVYYLGESYVVELQKDATLKKCMLVFSDSKLMINTPLNVTQEELVLALNTFYKKEAMEFIEPMVKAWSAKMGLVPNFVGYRKAKTRWGSCSSKDRISFSYYLMKLPLPLVEYVVVHELAHIEHKNHSANFWALVGQHLGDYKEKQAKIREFERLF